MSCALFAYSCDGDASPGPGADPSPAPVTKLHQASTEETRSELIATFCDLFSFFVRLNEMDEGDLPDLVDEMDAYAVPSGQAAFARLTTAKATLVQAARETVGLQRGMLSGQASMELGIVLVDESITNQEIATAPECGDNFGKRLDPKLARRA